MFADLSGFEHIWDNLERIDMKYLREKLIRVSGILLSIILILELCFSCSYINVQAEETEEDSTFLPPKKVVSVVYDDSTSMRAFGGKLLDNWATANYAMQSLTALLGTRDELYITKMSEYTQSKEVDLSDKSHAINEIRNNVEWADGTYLEAVVVAMNKLKLQAKEETDENTQYWLVVITDGAFNECHSMATTAEKKRFLNDNLHEYVETVMPNGSNPQVIFMGISGALSPDEDQKKGIFLSFAPPIPI